MRQKISILFIAISFGVIGACGADSTITQLFTLDGSKDRLDARIAEARALYDNGEYSASVKLFDSILQDYPNSETAAIIGSYAALADVGLGFFDIVRVVALSEEDVQKEDNAAIKQCAALSNIIATNGQQGKLDCLLGIEPGDDIFNGQTVNEARISNTTLAAMNKIISNLCRFFEAPENENDNSTERYFSDSRHNCGDKVNSGDSNGRGSLVWALAHLFEATIFNIQASYLETSAENLVQDSDISSAMSALGSILGEAAGQTSFATEAVSDLSTAVNALAKALGSDTQLSALTEATTRLNQSIEKAFGNKNNPSQPGQVEQKIDQSIIARKDDINNLSGDDATEFCEGYEGATGNTNLPPGIEVCD